MPTEVVPKLVLINPQNEASVAASSLAPRLPGLQGKRVGLLDNSKNKAGKMLDTSTAPGSRPRRSAPITSWLRRKPPPPSGGSRIIR
jgi:hypothetical protein